MEIRGGCIIDCIKQPCWEEAYQILRAYIKLSEPQYTGSTLHLHCDGHTLIRIKDTLIEDKNTRYLHFYHCCNGIALMEENNEDQGRSCLILTSCTFLVWHATSYHVLDSAPDTYSCHCFVLLLLQLLLGDLIMQ